MKKCCYVVTMYRWGDRECHSYVLGVYTTKTKAEKAAMKEQEYRGGTKYYPECLEIPFDIGIGYIERVKTIIPLIHNPLMIAVKHKP